MTFAARILMLALAAHPADAVALAVADCGQLTDFDRPFQRFVWCPTWLPPESPWGVSYAVNLAVSRSDVIQIPAIVEGKPGVLVRWDLRRLSRGDEATFAELHALWERLGETEPYFTVRATVSGKIVAAPAGHTGIEQATILHGLTKSACPIVRADWFLTKILTTTQGGLYYEFAGIKKSPNSNQTDQEFWLAKFGASEQTAKLLRADQRVAMFRSGVTGKPRRADWIKPQSGRDSDGRIFITHDIADGDVDAFQHPMRNLLKFNDRAREAIALKNNGLQEFTLFNDAGALQRDVPDNIARDGGIPFPNTSILEPAMGCIRCHGPDDGYKPMANDVLRLLDGGVDVFGDARSKGGYSETLDQLAALYTGRAEKHLARARDDYNEAVVRATEGRLGADGVSAVAAASALVAAISDGYRYNLVSVETALLELGETVNVPQGGNAAAVAAAAVQNQEALKALWPPLPPDDDGFSPEDPVIGAIRSGIGVIRADWDGVYADAALRAMLSKPQADIPVIKQQVEIEVEP